MEYDCVVCALPLILVIFSSISSAHDMCLGGNSPKDRTNEQMVDVCGKYKTNGCCDSQALRGITDKLSTDMSIEEIPKICLSLFTEILCQKCSPKSGHLFEGETKEDRKFPILCQSFCRKLNDNCAEYIVMVFGKEICDPDASDKTGNCYPKTDSLDEKHEEVKENEFAENCIPICLRKITDGVKNVVDGAFPQDNSNRLFVVQQNGIIWELSAKRERLQKPFLNIASKVQQSGAVDERGLLSMVFDPDFLSNKYFYLFYNPSMRGTRERIVRMKVSDIGPPMVVEEESEKLILEFPKPEGNHDGGQLFFGNDGYLYITTGDGGGGGDKHGTRGNGQSLTTLLGNILRIDVKSNPNVSYTIPDDNPFVNSDGMEKKEIFAYGLRNPWRTSIDRETDRIFCGDVGQNHIEEVDIIVKGGNYGWRAYEGNNCYDQQMCDEIIASDQALQWPIYSYTHDVGQAVIGGYVYRGSNVPELNGKYVYGDQRKSQIWALEENGDKWENRNICVGKSACPDGTISHNPRQHLFAFAQDEKGELYMFVAKTAKMTEANGEIYKLISAIN
ncbi:HHIP-like protein 2 [Styela clava]